MTPDVRVYPSLEELSREAAAEFEALAHRRAEAGKGFYVALSGGSTPRRLYELLGSPGLLNRIPWASVHVFQVDERAVPPDDPRSNYRMIREALLSRAPIPSDHIHRLRGEASDLEEAARDYEAELERAFRPGTAAPPRFDLILLGLGADGHTASLFPGSKALGEQTRWVTATEVAPLGARRLTLTLPVLNAAERVLFLVAGDEKAWTLRQVLYGPGGRYPAQLIRPAHGRVTWYVDKAAARRLEDGTGEGPEPARPMC
jgi:6-phosphogluconolactonase